MLHSRGGMQGTGVRSFNHLVSLDYIMLLSCWKCDDLGRIGSIVLYNS